MIELATFLKRLISLPGLSGFEGPAREVIAEAWQPLVDELTVSRLGSLHGIKRGSSPEPRPRILLAAHMDAIGLMATTLSAGLIRFTEVGGVDPRILPGQPVTVHGRRDLPGVVVQPPDRLLPPELRGNPVPMENLFVDTGLLPEEVESLVRPGDLISFAQPPIELAGDGLAGHNLDNRTAVAAVTLCLEALQRTRHDWDVIAAATVQEEETLGGAFTSAFDQRPDIAIAIDVTHAKGPGASDWRTHPFNKGVPLGWGPNVHPGLFQGFKDVADQLEISWRIDPLPRFSGTDAYAMQIVAEGIPTMVIGIPLRYMHTPVELVHLEDIRRAGRLLAEYIARLQPDTLQKLSWD